MKISLAGLSELRAVCEKGLLLLAITIPEMEVKWKLDVILQSLLFAHLISKSTCGSRITFCFVL